MSLLIKNAWSLKAESSSPCRFLLLSPDGKLDGSKFDLPFVGEVNKPSPLTLTPPLSRVVPGRQALRDQV